MRQQDPFNPRQYRSVSQLKQYERCPHSYYLSRIQKAWQRPAAWLPQGSAVHAVYEQYRKREVAGEPMTLDEALDLFRVEYQKEVGQYCATTPNFEWWSKSGPYGGEADIERRYHIGLEQVEKFFAWTEGHPEEVIWIAPDGTPGLELEFDIELNGIPVRGFIDVVLLRYNEVGDAEIVVRDIKTGNPPDDSLQLGVYAVALAETYGIPQPTVGDYYMAGKKGVKGKASHPYDLSEWTRDRVAEKFRELEDNLQAGRFDPDPEPDRCLFCDVSYACSYRE